MNVLCFDIASGGLSAAIFDDELTCTHILEIPWQIPLGPDGSAVLDISVFDRALEDAMRSLPKTVHVDAISFSAFMHNCVLLDSADRPLTPILTWMDRRGSEAVERIRSVIGRGFHERTGCRYHPMFPIFKVASQQVSGLHRVVSAKSLAVAKLTGSWVEDHGTASASGLYNGSDAAWDHDLLRLIGLRPDALPPLADREATVGHVTTAAASRYGIESGTPVINGSGDGFLANAGSGCELPGRMAVTLGTSSSVRQVLPVPILDENAGTYCYRAGASKFLLGCASSNGGNVLDWARGVFGTLPEELSERTDLPTFIPLLHGERSPEWNPSLTASWHGVRSLHTSSDLAYAAAESVVFNLAHYVEILERASGTRVSQVVLSGNGFLNRLLALTMAAILDAEVLLPPDQGLASLRGAAVCGLRGMGVDPASTVERLVSGSEVVPRVQPDAARQRYRRYREHREKGTGI